MQARAREDPYEREARAIERRRARLEDRRRRILDGRSRMMGVNMDAIERQIAAKVSRVGTGAWLEKRSGARGGGIG